MALEDLLRDAAKRGITHLSLHPTPSEDGKTIYWRAQATPSTGHKYVSCADLDPVVALAGVLHGLPKAPARTPSTKSAAMPITAAVIDPINGGPFRGVDQHTFKTVPEPVASAEAPPLNLEEEFASWLPKP